MITTKCLLGFSSHQCLVSIDDSGFITAFKYNEQLCCCDWAKFDIDDHMGASDFILEPPNPLMYYVKVDNDDPIQL